MMLKRLLYVNGADVKAVLFDIDQTKSIGPDGFF